jgi:hypothetical protein
MGVALALLIAIGLVVAGLYYAIVFAWRLVRRKTR